ncbi:hypothetical protein KW783_01125 [Candidatus Parcubacteria bacterium]|nr:hypothetical protein [Candidatus Parcubacteria bacterium]
MSGCVKVNSARVSAETYNEPVTVYQTQKDGFSHQPEHQQSIVVEPDGRVLTTSTLYQPTKVIQAPQQGVTPAQTSNVPAPQSTEVHTQSTIRVPANLPVPADLPVPANPKVIIPGDVIVQPKAGEEVIIKKETTVTSTTKPVFDSERIIEKSTVTTEKTPVREKTTETREKITVPATQPTKPVSEAPAVSTEKRIAVAEIGPTTRPVNVLKTDPTTRPSPLGPDAPSDVEIPVRVVTISPATQPIGTVNIFVSH